MGNGLLVSTPTVVRGGFDFRNRSQAKDIAIANVVLLGIAQVGVDCCFMMVSKENITSAEDIMTKAWATGHREILLPIVYLY